jgi:hypothetical protein
MTTFNVTVTFSYGVADEDAMASYGTTDPAGMAAVDQANWMDDVIALGAQMTDGPYTITVTPANATK